jgi:hypothetical protein
MALYMLQRVDGLSVKEAAARLGVNYNNARRCKHIYTKNTRPEMIEFHEEVYTGKSTKVTLPVYTGHQTHIGDAICVGDVHVPTTNWEIAEWVYQVGANTGIKTLIIAGDLLNVDAFSYYPPVVPEIDFGTEQLASKVLLAHYADQFDKIVITLGNHELRYMKARRGSVTTDELLALVSDDRSRAKMEISPYPYMNVVSSGVNWHVTHPRDFSRQKITVGNKLAQKHQSNVVLFHQHHVGKSVDDYGRYVIIDGGGLFDDKKMAYVAMQDSTSPTMNNGFVVIRGGVGHLITPYPAYTDLAQWGLERRQK